MSVGPKIAEVLVKIQKKIKPVIKDAENPFFHSDYATLGACLEATVPIFNEYGVALIQTTDVTEYGPVLVTRLVHSSGEFIEGRYPLLTKDNSPQAMGSAVTYAKRYALCAIIGLPTLDDDGNTAQTIEPKKTQPDSVRTQNKPYPGTNIKVTADPGLDKDKVDKLKKAAERYGWTSDDLKNYWEPLGIKALKDLKFHQYADFMKKMETFPKPGFPRP